MTKKELKPFDSKSFLATLTDSPGVYQMIDKTGKAIYVGKARNLKKRVQSYFQSRQSSAKTNALMSHVVNVEVIVTRSENEALLLENNLIKQLNPKYNILLRDDKSYPYIYLSSHQDFPRLDFYRGNRKGEGSYFGPYPNVGAVRETLNLLQKIFRVRSCNDTFFRNRSRPCIQYQIKRCSAPCVNLIDKEQYQHTIRHVVLFLEGKNEQVIEELEQRMQTASTACQYELAAKYRDQISSLRKIQQQQFITKTDGDIDVLAVVCENFHVCVQVLYIRSGRIIGSRSHFPRVPENYDETDVLTAFIPQYYLGPEHINNLPKTIIVNVNLQEQAALENLLTELKESKVKLSHNVRGERAQWLRMAIINAKHAIAAARASQANLEQQFMALQSLLQLNNMPMRLECFDVSHTFGEQTVASCVVFDHTGAVKKDYRRFNIKDITKGDDYAALKQALTRHYTRLKQQEKKLPDLLFIDGGKGQVGIAKGVLEELQITAVKIIGVSKGSARKPGLEKLILSEQKKVIPISADRDAQHLIQQIRDEAHRFAITGHRKQRGKQQYTSILKQIEGIGPKRRQALLNRFAGLQAMRSASVDELAKVKGISQTLAKKIYAVLRDIDNTR
ncbi:MAG: excinuclease ABC subunit UvrC [Gammaproteobacteria bacterium]